jgi:hypothetical protein
MMLIPTTASDQPVTDAVEAQTTTISDQAIDHVGKATGALRRPVLSDQTPPLPSSTALPEVIRANWGGISEADISPAMLDDLVRLAMFPDGWRGPGTLSLRSRSLNDFLEFWTAIREDAVKPELALAPDGTLQAEWFKSFRQHLDARFVQNKVYFGLFSNSEIWEGVQSATALANYLKDHPAKPFRWRAG